MFHLVAKNKKMRKKQHTKTQATSQRLTRRLNIYERIESISNNLKQMLINVEHQCHSLNNFRPIQHT